MLDSVFIFFVAYPWTAYAGLFLILLFSGLGLGLLPEEITLLLGGWLAHLGLIRLDLTFIILTAGILGADMVGYAFGRLWGAWLEERVIARWRLAADMIEKTKRLFERYGEKFVLVSRIFFGVRAVIPMFAGHMRMKFRKFLLYDMPMSVPWSITVIAAGYYFSATLDVFAEVRMIKHYIFLGTVLAAACVGAVRLVRGARLRT